MFDGPDIPQDRWYKAYRHRTQRNLIQTSAWLGLDEITEVEGPYWTPYLFAVAAGGDAEWTALALENGANAKDRFRTRWGGVLDGQYVLTQSEEPAYRWVARLDHPQDERVLIWNAMEAAVAGGCDECIELVANAGGNLDGTWEWIRQLPRNVPRTEAALAILAVYASRGKSHEHLAAAQSWLTQTEKWIRRRVRRKGCGESEWGRLVQLYRRAHRTAVEYEIERKNPPKDLADLL